MGSNRLFACTRHLESVFAQQLGRSFLWSLCTLELNTLSKHLIPLLSWLHGFGSEASYFLLRHENGSRSERLHQRERSERSHQRIFNACRGVEKKARHKAPRSKASRCTISKFLVEYVPKTKSHSETRSSIVNTESFISQIVFSKCKLRGCSICCVSFEVYNSVVKRACEIYAPI